MDINPAARLSIVAYRPKPGKEQELLALTAEHVPFLRRIGVASSRPHIAAIASGGIVIEVFEWAEGGLQTAHAHPGVHELWARYAAACDYVPLNTLDEAAQIFASFVALN